MIKVTETGLLLKGNLPSILSETACILRHVHKKTIDKLGPEFGEILYQKTIALADMDEEDMEKELEKMETEKIKMLNDLFSK